MNISVSDSKALTQIWKLSKNSKTDHYGTGKELEIVAIQLGFQSRKDVMYPRDSPYNTYLFRNKVRTEGV